MGLHFGAGLDFAAVKGVRGRSGDLVPALVDAAFGAESEGSAAKKAATQLRELLVGEGAFTSAGALAFPALLSLLRGTVGDPYELGLLLVDLVYGTEPFLPGPPNPAKTRRGAASEIRRALSAAAPELVGLLLSREPAVRGCAALLLGAARDPGTAAPLQAALRGETRDDVRAAMCFGAAGWASTSDLLAPSLAAPSAPERLAAALAAFVDQGDEAPDLSLVQLGAWPTLRAPAPGFPLPAVLGWVVKRVVLTSGCPRAVALFTDQALDRIDRALPQPRDSSAWNAALGELEALVACHLPDPTVAPDALPPLARAVLERTVHRSLGVAARFEIEGLPDTLGDRRAWLRLDRAAGLDPDDPLRVVLEAEASYEGVRVARSLEAVRTALGRVPAPRALAWARDHLARRIPYPGASLAPNGPLALVALERLDDTSLERLWRWDHEPVLAALTAMDPARLALLARLPLPSRAAAWREHADHVNPAVALARGLAAASVCPTDGVARELVALALLAPDPQAAAVRQVLASFGSAGEPALAALRALTAAA